jgi:hypothetical protein
MNDRVLEPDEAYARRKLAGMTAEGRTAYVGMTDDELIDLLRADYWADLDSGLGEFDGLSVAELPRDNAPRRGSGDLR